MLNRNTLKGGRRKTIPSKKSKKQLEGTLFWASIDRERIGVPVAEFAGNIHKLGISKTRAAQIFKMSRSTLAHKIASNGKLVRIDALAAIRLEKLCNMAEDIASNSLHPDAKGFNVGKWLGAWIEMPQPVLDGLRPSDLLDTEAGAIKVFQMLRALESGVYL